MSDGGSGGKQSPRGCAEYILMPNRQKYVRASLNFLASLKEFVCGKIKNTEKEIAFSDNGAFYHR